MQGPDFRWIQTGDGVVPKYDFAESFPLHVVYVRYLVEDLVPPHKFRRRKEPMNEHGVVQETGFRRYL